MENNTRIDLQAIAPGKMIPLANTTLDMLFWFLQRPDGRELLEQKKAELRARGVI